MSNTYRSNEKISLSYQIAGKIHDWLIYKIDLDVSLSNLYINIKSSSYLLSIEDLHTGNTSLRRNTENR